MIAQCTDPWFFVLFQVFVDEFTCIGCKNCCNVCPKSFMIEDAFGRARVSQQGMDNEEMLQEAIDTCPVNCIHWVCIEDCCFHFLLAYAAARIFRCFNYLFLHTPCSPQLIGGCLLLDQSLHPSVDSMNHFFTSWLKFSSYQAPCMVHCGSEHVQQTVSSLFPFFLFL